MDDRQETVENQVMAIRGLLDPLLVRLRSLPEADRPNGVKAAQVFEDGFEEFEKTTDPQAMRQWVYYGLSGKGMMDWSWSEKTREELQEIADSTYKAVKKTEFTS
jgi:hypothetical protein